MERRFPAAAAFTVLVSLLVSAPRLLRWRAGGQPDGDSPSALSLRPEAVRGLEVHRFLTYIFAYEDAVSFICGMIIIWYFAGSFEKTVGTVRHCILTLAFTISTAVLYLLLRALLSRLVEVADLRGFNPVALAMLAASIARSRMKKMMLLGAILPMVLLPWLLLCLAWLVLDSSFLGNFCGLMIGNVYGYGYCFSLDLPESTISSLDRKFPFRLLKKMPGLKYIPGSLAERRASQSKKLNPVPGSYPTQSYHSPPLPGQQSNTPIPRPGPPYVPGPALQQNGWGLGGPSAQHYWHAPAGPFPASLHLSGPNPQVPRKADGSGVPQTSGVLAGRAASESVDHCRVHLG